MTQTVSLEEQLLQVGEGSGTPIEVTFENYEKYGNHHLPLGKYYQFSSIPYALMAWDFYRAQLRRSGFLVPERIVKTAAFISNALNNEYLRQLVENAAALPKKQDARIVLSGVVGWGSEGIVKMFPIPIIEIYLDAAGYNFNDKRIENSVSYSWGASIADLLPHAAHIVRIQSAWLPEPEEMASTVRNNAYMLQQKLEKKDA